MARISVDSSAVSHNKNGEGGGGVTYVMGGNGGSGSYNSLTVQSINAANGNIDYLKSKSISANDMSMIYISAVDGTIQKLKGSSANFDQGYFSALGADTIDANKLTVKDIDAINAWIETLQSREITTEYLTVTKQAHFFELIIDKIRSVGGQLIITPASCTVDYVWGVDSNGDLIPADPDNYANTDYYDIFWRTTQDDGRSVTNDWIVNDQAICQSFNNVSVGVNYDVANKYYWRLVTDILDDVYVNLSTGALSNSANNPACNEFEVVMYKTTSILNNLAYDNNISWGCKAQTIDGIETNVSWADGTLGADEVVHGIFKSASQLYGIQIEPTITENLPATTSFQLQIKQKGADDTYSIIPEKINIAVYFTDDSFLMWNDVQLDANGNFFFNMPDANSAIKSIIINSTEDVKWHKCHRIRVSNNYIPKDEQHPTVPANNSGCDYVVVESASVPSTGDNLIQLGYRGTDDIKRQSAIIIAAYMTPDKDLTCPSYAHYIGINDFHLSDHRHSYFDANGAKFLGDITLANVGDMTAKDKWMKLNMASSPIEVYYHNAVRNAIYPTTYSLTITTLNDDGDTVTLTEVPQGYKVFIYYYDFNGKLNYGPDSVSAGSSLSGLTAPNTFVINNVNKYVQKIECVLVKGTSATTNIIDKVNIEYGNTVTYNTDSWCLIPKKEVAYATILDAYNAPTTTANDQRVKLYVSLQYGIGHYLNGVIENEQFDYDASTNPNGFRLVAHAYYQSFGNGVMGEFTNNNITWTKSVSNTICTFEVANYLQTLHNNQYLDYMDNYKNNRQKNPVMIQVELVKGGEVLDSRTVYVSMQSGAIQKLTDNSWISAISSSKEYTDQAMTGPLGDITTLQQDMSTIQQWATGISQTVDSNFNTLTGEIGDVSESLHSEIEQTAGMIRTEVRRDYGNSAYHLNSSNSYWTMIDTDGDQFDADKYYLVNIAYQTIYPRKYVYTFQVENESNENFDLMLNVTYISASDGDWVGGNKYVNEYYLQNADIVIGDVAEDTDAWEMKFYVRGKHKYIFRCPEVFYACGYLYDTNNQHIYPDERYYKSSVTEPQNYRPTQSSIEQTAERISLEVVEVDGVTKEQLKTTGIDITNGKIELTADNTIINGNLNVIESGQTGEQEGITLYDSDNNARVNILANNIPDPTDPNSTFSAYNSFNIESDWTTKTTSDNINITTSKKAIGSFSNGSTLTMYIYPTITGYVNGSTSIVNNVPGTISCTLNLYKDGGSTISNYLTQSINVAGSNPRHYPRTIFTISNLAAGSYEAEINITGDDSNNRYVNYKIICDTSFYKLSDSLTYLGLDGLLVGTSENNYAKISKDGYELRYTDTGSNGEIGAALKMNNSGFQRAYKLDSNGTPVNWVAFDGYCGNVTKLSASDFTPSTFYYGNTQVIDALSYIVQPNDVNIFIAQNTTGSGDLYIRLTDGCGGESISQQASSSTLMPGRRLFIRNLSGRTVFICAGSTGSHQFLLTREGIDKVERENIGNNNYTVMTVPTCIFNNVNYCDWAIIQRN